MTLHIAGKQFADSTEVRGKYQPLSTV